MIRSPRLAAIGVATLSGLTFTLRDNNTTPTISEPVGNINVMSVIAMRMRMMEKVVWVIDKQLNTETATNNQQHDLISFGSLIFL